jgi:hypothetical protein
MSKTIRLYSWLAPVISYQGEKIGQRSYVVVNTNGGMAGGSLRYFGIISPCKRKGFKGFITIKLTETNKEVDINPTSVRSIEEVMVWKEKIVHNNPNYKGDRIKYFATGLNIAHILFTNVLSLEENSQKHKDIRFHEIEEV